MISRTLCSQGIPARRRRHSGPRIVYRRSCLLPLVVGGLLALIAPPQLAQNEVRFPANAFTHLTVDPNPPDRPWYKMAGDINGDGYIDIVVGGAKGPLIAYLYPDWRRQKIADSGWDGVNGEVADIDGDGDPDIVMGGVVWFENPGSDGGLWEEKRIDERKANDIEVADLNLDGRLDVVARDQSAFGSNGNRISIYLQSADSLWERQTLDCPHGEGLRLGDLDRDGDPDIVIGGLYFANSGGPEPQWNIRRYTRRWVEPDAKVDIGDFNGDGRPDIVLTPAELKGETHPVAWYEAPSDESSPEWEQHIILPSIECVVHALAVGDLDGDDVDDIVLAEMHQGEDPDDVLVLYNRDRGSRWERLLLSTRGSHDLILADIDGDGDLDVIVF